MTNKAEELTVGSDAHRRLADGERHQLGILYERRPAKARRDLLIVGEDVGCNDEGLQIRRHLELLSRGKRVWRPSFVAAERVPARPAQRITSSL